MKKFIIHKTPLCDLRVIEHKIYEDQRGLLSKLFCHNALNVILKGKVIKQINKTLTRKKGTVRGLHFQYPPFSETKIINCLKGKVWDVAVDLRLGSPTYLNYHAEILTEDDNKSYIIPEGFAHGFQTLTSNCEMLYFHTADYRKEFEEVINVIDPMIAINWPQPIMEQSDRDRNSKMLTSNFKGINLNELSSL